MDGRWSNRTHKTARGNDRYYNRAARRPPIAMQATLSFAFVDRMSFGAGGLRAVDLPPYFGLCRWGPNHGKRRRSALVMNDKTHSEHDESVFELLATKSPATWASFAGVGLTCGAGSCTTGSCS